MSCHSTDDITEKEYSYQLCIPLTAVKGDGFVKIGSFAPSMDKMTSAEFSDYFPLLHHFQMPLSSRSIGGGKRRLPTIEAFVKAGDPPVILTAMGIQLPANLEECLNALSDQKALSTCDELIRTKQSSFVLKCFMKEIPNLPYVEARGPYLFPTMCLGSLDFTFVPMRFLLLPLLFLFLFLFIIPLPPGSAG